MPGPAPSASASSWPAPPPPGPPRASASSPAPPLPGTPSGAPSRPPSRRPMSPATRDNMWTGRWRRTGTSGTGSRWRCGSCRGRRTAGWCGRGCGSARRSRPSGPRSPTTRASPDSSPASPSAASSTRTRPSPASTRSGSRIWRWGSSSTPRAPSTATRARWSCSRSPGRAVGRSPSTWSMAISRSLKANGLSTRSMVLLTMVQKFQWDRNFRLRFLTWWSWSLSSGFRFGYWKGGFARRSKPTLFVSDKKQRGSKGYWTSDNWDES